ncbi:MAG: SoxR reducing system RseC family protein [Bacteroidales bacterium]|nr:SoxR reducing system RseC family protein [Bacteroidales bacterium]
MTNIEHSGTVLSSQNGAVEVQIEVLSACAHCEAHARCGMADSKEKIVTAHTDDWQTYHAGDKVNVIMSEQNGLLAVLFAYVLPSVLILAAFISLCLLHVPELLTALTTLAVTGVYVLLLYFNRNRLQKKFSIQIAHI